VTERLARAASRRPWRTVAAWGVVLVLSVVAVALLLGGALTSEGDITTEPESKRAEALLEESFPPGLSRASSW
jgi:RND superfamily putative drug exporter